MICMERLSCPSGYDSPEGCGQALQPGTVGKFTKCGHTLHMLCMLAMYNNGNKVMTLTMPSFAVHDVMLDVRMTQRPGVFSTTETDLICNSVPGVPAVWLLNDSGQELTVLRGDD